MTNHAPIAPATIKSMSSTEIAVLTGKRKNDIHQDIKKQLFISLYGLKDGGNLHHEQIQGLTVVMDNRGYWSEVILDRYHTDILISGYEVKYRAAIVKRWHELEALSTEPPAQYGLKQLPPDPEPESHHAAEIASIHQAAEYLKAFQHIGAEIGLDKKQALLACNHAIAEKTGVNIVSAFGIVAPATDKQLDTLSRRVKYLRARNKITQGRLAELTGVMRATIAKIETDASFSPRPENIDALAAFFGVSAAWLIYGEESV